jgi:hypothetical protein
MEFEIGKDGGRRGESDFGTCHVRLADFSKGIDRLAQVIFLLIAVTVSVDPQPKAV